MKLVTYRRDYNKNDIWTEIVETEAMAIRLSIVLRATIIKIEDVTNKPNKSSKIIGD